MLKSIPTLAIFLFLCTSIVGQDCETERYQRAIFDNVTITEDIVYSTADVYDVLNLPINFDFRLDVYEPEGDTREKRPMVVMMFGGAYIFGDKEHADMIAWCDSLARYGYVAVSIDYRLGVNALSSGSAVRAMYRGVQDTRAAIRYMLEFQDQFRIDPNHIYVGGESAGAINALHTAFMTTEAERPQESYGIPFENFDLGCLDCSGNSYEHEFDIKGVIDLWGGVLDLDYISSNESIPSLIIHGDNDFIVPHDEGYPFLNDFQLTFPYLYTSIAINEHMDDLGIYNELYIYPEQGHLFYGLPDGIITFPNEFWNPVWTQGHEFLYEILDFDSPQPTGELYPQLGIDYSYSVPLQAGSEYCWNIIGGQIVGLNNNEVTVQWDNSGNNIGELSVSEINCIGMKGRESAPLIVNLTVSNQDLQEQLGIGVQPNIIPQGGTITLQNPRLLDYPFFISDASGKRIHHGQLQNQEMQSIILDLPKGFYILTVSTESTNYSQKIMVQ